MGITSVLGMVFHSMSRWTLPTVMLAFLGITAFIAWGTRGAREHEPARFNPQRLTVAETLGLVYASYIDSSPLKFYRRANPEAKQYLYKILEDPAQEQFHENVWFILGYIGDKSDVNLLEKRLHEFSGPLTSTQRKTLTGMFNSLGLMCRRGVEAACALGIKMQRPEYWDGVDFQWYDRPMPQRPPFAYESIMRLMYGYSLSQRDDLKQQVQKILAGIEDPALRKQMATSLDPGLLARRANNMPQHENDPVTREELQEIATLFNGDLENPGPSNRVLGIGGRDQDPPEPKAAPSDRKTPRAPSPPARRSNSPDSPEVARPKARPLGTLCQSSKSEVALFPAPNVIGCAIMT